MTNYFDVQSNYTSGVTCDIWVRPTNLYPGVCTKTDPLLWKMVVNNQTLTNGHKTFAVAGDMHLFNFFCSNSVQGLYTNIIVQVILRHGSDVWTSPEYIPQSYANGHCPPNCSVPAQEFIMNSTPNNPWDSGYYLPITNPTGTVVHDFPACPPTCPTNTHCDGIDTDFICVANPVPPVANFNTNSRKSQYYPTPLTVEFINTTTGDQPITYVWYFGDGTTSTEQTPTHTYTAPGSKDVTLVATNAGGSSTKVLLNFVEIRVQLPAVDFTANVVSGDNPLTVEFTSSVLEYYPGWYSYTYEWSFGDGTTSTSINPVHTYEAGGGYTVILNLVGSAGWGTRNVKEGYIIVNQVTEVCPSTCPDGYYCDGAATNYECVPNALQCPSSCSEGYYCDGEFTNYECVPVAPPDVNWIGVGVGAAVLGYLLLSGKKQDEVK